MRTHRTAGLDQLGPCHWQGNKVDWRNQWHKRNPLTVKARASTSSKLRKVKVTLATTPYRWEEH